MNESSFAWCQSEETFRAQVCSIDEMYLLSFNNPFMHELLDHKGIILQCFFLTGNKFKKSWSFFSVFYFEVILHPSTLPCINIIMFLELDRDPQTPFWQTFIKRKSEIYILMLFNPIIYLLITPKFKTNRKKIMWTLNSKYQIFLRLLFWIQYPDMLKQ